MANPETTNPDQGDPEGISILVCTYNGSQTIARTLESIQAQTGLDAIPIEVILIDNASTDGTAEKAVRAWESKSISLSVILEERPGLSEARLTGYKASRYSLLCWIDDDVFIQPGYLAYGFQLMARFPRAAICGGCGEALLDGIKPPWFTAVASSYAIGAQGLDEGLIPRERGYVYGAGAFLRRQALDELVALGFQPLLSGRQGEQLTGGEDSEICCAVRLLGWQIIHSKNLIFKHALPSERLTWNYAQELFRGFGQADVALSIYRIFLRPSSWKSRLQRIFLHYDLRRRLKRANRNDRSRAHAAIGHENPGNLFQERVRGRIEETKRLEETGDLRRFIRQIARFEKRARSLRSARALATGF